jgi:hypothetical protein
MKIFYLLSILSIIIFPLPAKAEAEIIKLPVPFIAEVTDGQWVAPWNNACEEAAITMVDQYYLGIKKISVQRSRDLLWPLFDIQDKLFGKNTDTDTEQTAKLANLKMAYKATVVDSPTLEQIKDEIRQARPVIVPVYGFGLNNPELRFRREGSSYHMLVLSGFDDAKSEFITQDSGTVNGLDFRYKYDTIMSVLHDFNHKESKVNGPAKAIFTQQNLLAKAEDGSRVYYIYDGIKHHITNPDLFKQFGWTWNNVRSVNREWLNKIIDGESIKSNTTLAFLNSKSVATASATEILAKAEGSNRIYLVKNDTKHYIAHPDLFKKYGWKWQNVKIVKKDWLVQLSTGEAIWQ